MLAVGREAIPAPVATTPATTIKAVRRILNMMKKIEEGKDEIRRGTREKAVCLLFEGTNQLIPSN